jgi:hypothetical protein
VTTIVIPATYAQGYKAIIGFFHPLPTQAAMITLDLGGEPVSLGTPVSSQQFGDRFTAPISFHAPDNND